MKKKTRFTLHFLALIILLTAVAAAGCSSSTRKSKKTDSSAWKNIVLRDVKTGKPFKISDFKRKTILLESFAVWCPTCRKQQDQIKELHRKVGDEVISVSIDTDPSENKARVLQHVNRNGFKWRFAIDEKGFAQGLVDEFGTNVVNAPSAPIVLINANQEARLLRFGVKSAEELQEEIDKG